MYRASIAVAASVLPDWTANSGETGGISCTANAAGQRRVVATGARDDGIAGQERINERIAAPRVEKHRIGVREVSSGHRAGQVGGQREAGLEGHDCGCGDPESDFKLASNKIFEKNNLRDWGRKTAIMDIMKHIFGNITQEYWVTGSDL
jgi:hypothetical protein